MGLKPSRGTPGTTQYAPRPSFGTLIRDRAPRIFSHTRISFACEFFYLNSTFFVRTANSFGYIYPSARRELRKLRSNFIPSTVGSGLLNITHDYLSPLVQNTKRYSVSMCGFSLGRKIAMGAESTLSVLSAHSQQGVRWEYAKSTLKVRWEYSQRTTFR